MPKKSVFSNIKRAETIRVSRTRHKLQNEGKITCLHKLKFILDLLSNFRFSDRSNILTTKEIRGPIIIMYRERCQLELPWVWQGPAHKGRRLPGRETNFTKSHKHI